MRTRTYFCFEARPPILEGRERGELLDMQVPDVILWRPTMSFCGKASSAKEEGFKVGTCPANLGLGIVKLSEFLFVSSILGTSLPVLESTGSPCVAVGLLPHTFLKQKLLVQMDLQERYLAKYTQVPCDKLRATIAARLS